MRSRAKRYTKYALILLSGMLVSCIIMAVAGYISNRNLPGGPLTTAFLDDLDKIRLAETINLRTRLGGEIWPGWDQAEIPLIVWNRDYEFLVGVSEPPAGWEAVPGDTFQGQVYYRRPAVDPQNFAVPIGDRWAASMATKYETDFFMQEVFIDILPPLVEDIFPYRLLILPSEVQISGVLHESFHVYQADVARSAFDGAETIYAEGESYWEADAVMHADWKAEIDLLIDAMQASEKGDLAELTRQFLSQRDQRRAGHDLSAILVEYEQCIEWLEGTAKYMELGIWEAASQSQGYTPLPETSSDPDFRGYQTFVSHWGREISQAKRQASLEGDVRFYYTGMLQARLLDRLMPNWKTHILHEGIFLEDLLRQAVSP
jgi:hypothetical protein